MDCILVYHRSHVSVYRTIGPLVTGVAFADKICDVKEGKSAAVVEDQGAYISVGTFVHELAHT